MKKNVLRAGSVTALTCMSILGLSNLAYAQDNVDEHGVSTVSVDGKLSPSEVVNSAINLEIEAMKEIEKEGFVVDEYNPETSRPFFACLVTASYDDLNKEETDRLSRTSPRNLASVVASTEEISEYMWEREGIFEITSEDYTILQSYAEVCLESNSIPTEDLIPVGDNTRPQGDDKKDDSLDKVKDIKEGKAPEAKETPTTTPVERLEDSGVTVGVLGLGGVSLGLIGLGVLGLRKKKNG